MKEWIPEKYEKVDWSKVKSLDQSVLSPIKKFALEKWKNCTRMCRNNVTSSWRELANCVVCKKNEKSDDSYISRIWSGSFKSIYKK